MDDERKDQPTSPERQVERTAQEMIEAHGCDQAAVEAAHHAQHCVNEGDQAECQRWLQILQVIRTWYDNRTTGSIAF
jgi:hypothetical protein